MPPRCQSEICKYFGLLPQLLYNFFVNIHPACIQNVNQIVTQAVNNLSKNAQELIDFLNQTILKEFQTPLC